MVDATPNRRVILSFNTLPEADFETRVRVAAEAGFADIGLILGAYRAIKDEGRDAVWMKEVLDSHGVRLTEVETIVGFDAGCTDRGESGPPWGPPELELGLNFADAEAEADFFEMAKVCGANHVVTVGSWKDLALDVDDATERFAKLCDRAARWDLTIALEYLLATNIRDLETARRIVCGADRPNGAIVADIYHHRHSPATDAELAAMPADKIAAIHLSDGFDELTGEDYLDDALHRREVPGDGEWDVAGFLAELWRRGVDAPVSTEFMCSSMRGLPADEAARRAANAMERVIRDATNHQKGTQ